MSFFLPFLLLGICLIPQSSVPAAAPKNTSAPTAESSGDTAQNSAPLPTVPAVIDLEHVKRIYVDGFGEDVISKQIEALIVTSLTNTTRFIVTENKDRADAILRGNGLEKHPKKYMLTKTPRSGVEFEAQRQ